MGVTIIKVPAKDVATGTATAEASGVTVEVSPSIQGLVNHLSTPPVPPDADDYSILDALKELGNGRSGVLMLRNIKSGAVYRVIKHDNDTNKTVLESEGGGQFSPVITPREVPQYAPIWRT